MKKLKTEVKKLRIGKETLLPLVSRQMNEVVGGAIVMTLFVHLNAPRGGTEVLHI